MPKQLARFAADAAQEFFHLPLESINIMPTTTNEIGAPRVSPQALRAIAKYAVITGLFALTTAIAHAAPEKDAQLSAALEDALRVQQRLEMAGELSVMFEQCAGSLPAFADKNRSQLKEWKLKNEATLAELEQHKMFGPSYRERMDKARKPAPPEWAENLKELCEGLAQKELGQKHSGPPADTPQQVWSSYLAALRKGDRAAALQCLSLEIRSQYRQLLDAMNPAAMRDVADQVKSLKMSTLVGASPGSAIIASAVVEMRGGNGGEIMFVKDQLSGRWLIGGM